MTDSPEGEGPVIRDRRRIDPTTGEVRPGAAQPAAPAAPAGDTGSDGSDTLDATGNPDLEAALAERTADLQRVQAEYANYRRRVDRDRQAVAEQALITVLLGLLPVLDDIDRAREHGEVEGGFKLVADGLETTIGKLGLERFASPGDPFDPTVHEALTHGYSAEVSEAVCSQVFQPGYRVGERVLRPARVGVLEPETTPHHDAGSPPTEEPAATDDDS